MRFFLLLVALMLCSQVGLYAQRAGALSEYMYPHEAESIRLGGAYTGVGRGLTAIHGNTAALGFQSGAQVLVSSGRSMAMRDFDFTSALDIEAAVFIPDWRTSVGVEVNVDRFKWTSRWHWDPINPIFRVRNLRVGIHLARRMNDWLALGIAVRRYSSQRELVNIAGEGGTGTAVGWDVSLSAHGRHGAAFLGRSSDEIHYGMTIDNILGTDMWYIDKAHRDPLHQALRLGAGYFWNPSMGRILNANILAALLTVETSIQGTELEFRNWGTVAGGAELRFLEVLMISAGVEHIVRTGNGYDFRPEYPVLRFGAGLDLPLDRILELDIPFILQIDYAHSQWNSDAEEEPHWNPADHPQQVNALSMQLRAGL